MLRVEAVCVDYGRVRALRDVTVEVEPGQVVSILGANGAGKTTLMRAISGLEPCRRGSIEFDGHRISAASTSTIVRRGISQVAAGRQLFAHMTVLENLRLGAPSRGSGARTATHEDLTYLLELFPVLGERGRQAAGTLSGGEQQMLAIARALMARPQLLLLDEPSLGLAPLVLEHIFATLTRLQRERELAILLVEQNAHLALDFASYAYVLETGQIVGSGPTADLRRTEDITRLYFGVEH